MKLCTYYVATFVHSFILLQFLDIATTAIAYFRFENFNESNPLYLLGVPLWILLILKVAIVAYLVYYMIYKYQTIDSPTGNYLILYFVSLVYILTAFVAFSNIGALQLEPQNVTLIEPEVRMEIYKNDIGNMDIVTRNNDMPVMVVLFIINMFQFFTWRCFEKWRLQLKTETKK